jgi:hypothetical protein
MIIFRNLFDITWVDSSLSNLTFSFSARLAERSIVMV